MLIGFEFVYAPSLEQYTVALFLPWTLAIQYSKNWYRNVKVTVLPVILLDVLNAQDLHADADVKIDALTKLQAALEAGTEVSICFFNPEIGLECL